MPVSWRYCAYKWGIKTEVEWIL